MSQIDLRLGRWQDVLADVDAVDSVITDPPYSERTHAGQRSMKTGDWMGDSGLSKIVYGHVTQEDVDCLVDHWVPRTKRWFVMFGDHTTVRWAIERLAFHDWYNFPPVPWVKPDASPRICGDGPSPQSESLAIARPRRRMFAPELRFRPGFYQYGMNRGGFVGSKPEALMRTLVRDYSEPGDLIVDPYSGTGTTLLSAAMEGRRAIGAECMPEHFEIARKRIACGWTPSLFTDRQPEPEQLGLLGDK